jgi:hypothetical protein
MPQNQVGSFGLSITLHQAVELARKDLGDVSYGYSPPKMLAVAARKARVDIASKCDD